MYTVTIYFNGPNSRWSGSVRPEETLAVQQVPWLWLARWRAKQMLNGFTADRVGWAISDKSGAAVEQSDAPDGSQA